MLEQDNPRKKRLDKKTAEQLEFEAGGDNKKYEMEDIRNNMVYTRELEASHLSGLYYLISWKDYSKDENTLEPASVVQYLRK